MGVYGDGLLPCSAPSSAELGFGGAEPRRDREKSEDVCVCVCVCVGGGLTKRELRLQELPCLVVSDEAEPWGLVVLVVGDRNCHRFVLRILFSAAWDSRSPSRFELGWWIVTVSSSSSTTKSSMSGTSSESLSASSAWAVDAEAA